MANGRDRRAYFKAYRDSHKEQISVRMKAYHACRKEETRTYKKVYDATHQKEHTDYVRNRRHELGINRPMSENKECSEYLGVHIAERILSKYFDHVERMIYGNVGFDFICGYGFKIDVKSSCIRHDKRKKNLYFWNFGIHHNIIADYFLCLAFDNRESLTPKHIWLIPASKVNHLASLSISNSSISIPKWAEYEKSLEKVTNCCTQLRYINKRGD